MIASGSPKPRQVFVVLLAVSVLFGVSVVLAIRFTDGLAGAVIGILASVMTPALGAMVTLLVVQPLRAIKTEASDIRTITAANGGKIDEVHSLVDGRMSTVLAQLQEAHDEIAALNVTNTALIVEVEAIHAKLNDRNALTIWRVLKNTFGKRGT